MGSPRRHFDTSMTDVSLFLDEPAAWFIRNYLYYKGTVGAKGRLGLAVEHGLTHYLLHGSQGIQSVTENLPSDAESSCNSDDIAPTLPTAKTTTKRGGRKAKADEPKVPPAPPEIISLAEERLIQLVNGEVSQEVEEVKTAIPGMLAQAMFHFKQFGTLIVPQKRIYYDLEGLTLLGFIDYLFEDGLVDLKTTMRVPGKPRPKDVRQVSFYSKVEGKKPFLVYVSDKKGVVYEIPQDDQDEAVQHIKAALIAIEEIKKGGRDWRDWARMYPPRDLGSFYFDDVSRHLVREIWNV